MPPRLTKLPTSSLRLVRSRVPLRSISTRAAQQLPKLSANPILPQKTHSYIRTLSSTPVRKLPPQTTGKSQADLIVEELQELYETTTDELEIATESTDNGTIYAASDRESARDALNTLVATYELYTNPDAQVNSDSDPDNSSSGLAGENQGGSENIQGGVGGVESEGGRLVELAFDPKDLDEGVREEIKRRVGQRVREVRSAVEGLEGRAHD
ncbi:hypothetical protein BJY04DRAFT_93620 [Aspergillus karnatakaensis]|uniref:uncharacterized protein n=1 Tax=Aspergillus karnatakaensis TaxID=1810916 RepID=UPI003CCC9C02